VLRRLIDDLRVRGPRDRNPREVEDLLARCGSDWEVGRRLVSRPGSYTRTCAYRDARFEIVLLRWAPGAASEIHDHGDQHCWMMVLDGRLTVDDYVRVDAGDRAGYAHVEARDSRLLGIGSMDARAGRFDLHSVSATHDAPAVSLHLYAAPLRQYMVYDEKARRCRAVRGTYDEVLSIYTEPVRR
jgi:cysteine dioxygenase